MDLDDAGQASCTGPGPVRARQNVIVIVTIIRITLPPINFASQKTEQPVVPPALFSARVPCPWCLSPTPRLPDLLLLYLQSLPL